MFFCQFRARWVLTRISHRLSIGVGLSSHCWCAATDIACRGECNNSRYHNVTATSMSALPPALTLCLRAVSLELDWFSFRLINALSGTCQYKISYVGANWSWFVRIASGPSGWPVNLCSDREHRFSAVRSEWCEVISVLWPCRAWRRKTSLQCRWQRWLTGLGRRPRDHSNHRPRRLRPPPICGSCNRHLLPITCPPLIAPWTCNVNIDKILLNEFLGASHYIENQLSCKKEMITVH